MESVSAYNEEANLLSSDSKFRSYASSMDKALKAFEGTGEWADLINSLAKMQKVLQSYSGKYSIIPRKSLVAKRLAQVLHPALPAGVHLKALEIYQIIFSVIGRKGLSDDLFLYSTGIFPLMGTCSMSTKPKVLEIFETFYVPLGNALQPAMPALLHGVLPGLEEGSEYFNPTFRLLEKFKRNTSNFNFAIWKCALDNSSTRFQALTFVMEVGSKNITATNKQNGAATCNRDSLFIDSDVMIFALCECLQDTTVLVQRIALDIVISLIGQDQRRLSDRDVVLLNCSAFNVLLRKDLSLNRRLYSWIFDQSDTVANEELFLTSLNMFISITEQLILQNDKNFNRNLMLRPLRVLNTLLDSKADMNHLLMAENGSVFTNIFRYLLSLTKAMLSISAEEMYERILGSSLSGNNKLLTNMFLDNRASGDLIKSANLLFQEIQRRDPGDLIWQFFARQLDVAVSSNQILDCAIEGVVLPRAKMTVSELCQFVSFFLDIILLETHEEAFEKHIPNFILKMTSWLCSNCESLQLHEIEDSLKLAMKLIEYVHPSACYVLCSSSGNGSNIDTKGATTTTTDGNVLTGGAGNGNPNQYLTTGMDAESGAPQLSSSKSSLNTSDPEDGDVKKKPILNPQSLIHSVVENGDIRIEGDTASPLPLQNGNLTSDEEQDVEKALKSSQLIQNDSNKPVSNQLDSQDEPFSVGDKTRHPGLEASIPNSSVVEACIKSIKLFFDKLLKSKLFKPSLNEKGNNFEDILLNYSKYLMKTFADAKTFENELVCRLRMTKNNSKMMTSETPNDCAILDSVYQKRISLEDNVDGFMRVFDLSCKLLHAICTLPIHKDADALQELGSMSTTDVELPPWLMSLFICSCFVSNFSIQAKATDCLLQQLALASSASEQHIVLSSDQRIVASISHSQMQVINRAYRLFLEICLSLWSWLETRHFLCHEKTVDLWLQLHKCCPQPISSLCEDAMVYCMRRPAVCGGLEACRRFSVVWHLSRTITHVHNLIAAGQPSFDKCLAVILDALSSQETSRKSVAKQWLLHCIARGDIARILEPLMLIMLHQKTCRILPQSVVVVPQTQKEYSSSHSPGQNSGTSRQHFTVLLQREKDPKPKIGITNHSESGRVVRSTSISSLNNPFAFSGAVFLSDVEREMMIDSEDFEHVDVEMIVKQIVSQLVEDAMIQSEANQCDDQNEPMTIDENSNNVAVDKQQSPKAELKHQKAKTDSFSETEPPLPPPIEGLTASIKSSIGKMIYRSSESSGKTISNDDSQPSVVSRSVRSHAVSSVSHLDSVFLNFFLLYNEPFDFSRCLHVFSTLSEMLKVDPIVFLNAVCSTHIGCGNTSYVHQVPTFILRHNQSIMGKNFFADVPPESLAQFRNSKFIELLISLCLYHLRSTFAQREQGEKFPEEQSYAEARTQNYAIQIRATEFLTDLFAGLNRFMETKAQENLPSFINELMFRCKVQRTVLLCLLCHVKTDIFTNVETGTCDNSDVCDEVLDSNGLELKLLELVSVLIQTEFYVFVAGKRGKGSILFKDANSANAKSRRHSSMDASFRYNSEELIVCQNFFVETVVESLKQTDFLSLQPHWLNFVLNILPYTCRARKDIVVPTVNQICRNLEILADDSFVSTPRVSFLPPDIFITLLENLARFFSLCTLEIPEDGNFAANQSMSFLKEGNGQVDQCGSPLKGWAVEDTVEESKTSPPILQSATVKKDYWLEAKKGLLDILPRVLSCLLHVWKRVTNKKQTSLTKAKAENATQFSVHGVLASRDFVMGQPEVVRRNIINIIESLAVAHSSKLYPAVALVWNGHREKNKLRKLSEQFTPDQMLLVGLINSIPSQNLSTIISNVTQVLKFSNPYIQVKKQPIMEISILQFFYAYVKTLPASALESNARAILSMVRDSAAATAHGGQVILLLIANYVIEKIITELKDLREVQELVSRLTEVLTTLASTGLVQSAWIGKIYTVRPGIQVPSNETDLILLQGSEWEQLKGTFSNQPISSNFVQAIEIMAQILPNLLDLIYRSEEKEKINTVIQNVLVVSTAFLKTRHIDNVPSLRAASRLTAEVSYFHYTRKSWKRDIFDLFLEKSFFQMTSEMVAMWKIVIDNLMTHDKVTFKEFLGQGNIAGVTGGLIKSRETELDLKAKLLKRLAFVVFASEKDQYQRILPELQERVTEMLKSGGNSPVVMEQIFLVFRIFLIRFNEDSLIALWPIMISELTVQLRQLEFDLMSEAGKLNLPNGSYNSNGGLNNHAMNESWLAMYLSLAKFLDTALLLSRLSLCHFQTYLWAFVGISGKEKASKSSASMQSQTSFVPYCVKIAQLLEDRLTSKQLANKTLPAQFGYPILHYNYYKLSNISHLQPFFSTICYHQFHQNNITLSTTGKDSPSPIPQYPEDTKASLKQSDDAKNPGNSQSLRKKLLHVNNLPMSGAVDADDFLEKLIERDFAELLA